MSFNALLRAVLPAADDQFRILDRHHAMRFDAMRQPDAAANDAVVADDGVATQDRGTGIDGDMVFQGGVALVAGATAKLTFFIAL